MQNNTSAFIDLIKLNWEDIHHSRNQDWKFWVVLAGLAAGLASLVNDIATNHAAICCLLVAGVAVSAVAALISWNHRDLLCKKTSHIEWLEALLAQDIGPRAAKGLPYQGRFKDKFRDRWSVSGIIFSFYVVVAVGFLIGLFFLAVPTIANRVSTAGALLVLSAVGLATFFVAYYVSACVMSPHRNSYRSHFREGSDSPASKLFIVSTEELVRAAGKKSRGLIKLAVSSCRPDETKWVGSEWHPTDSGLLPVLLAEENFFELSFATEFSPQDRHAHAGVYEIYLSESPLTIHYDGVEDQECSVTVKGLAIVPPGLWHRVELDGPTFVFQTSADGLTRIAKSKVVPHDKMT